VRAKISFQSWLLGAVWDFVAQLFQGPVIISITFSVSLENNALIMLLVDLFSIFKLQAWRLIV